MYADLVWDWDEIEHRNFIDNLAPIVLFTYNRLDHTRQTVEALRENVYAKDSLLFIFSDAPKNQQAMDSVQNVREYLHSVDGFKEIQIIERKDNWGLARNIMDGVTSIVEQYGKIIVLEDDIVTSKWFLKYMNDALELYKNNEQVMCISGYSFVNDSLRLSEACFLHWTSCWGWGTWNRAWKHFKREPEKLRDSIIAQDIYKINLDGTMPGCWQQVLDNCNGKIYTWAVFWHIAITLKLGLTLFPRNSLTNNIGMDGSGEHCGNTSIYTRIPATGCITTFPEKIVEDAEARKKMKAFFKKSELPRWYRWLQKLKNMVGNSRNS